MSSSEASAPFRARRRVPPLESEPHAHDSSDCRPLSVSGARDFQPTIQKCIDCAKKSATNSTLDRVMIMARFVVLIPMLVVTMAVTRSTSLKDYWHRNRDLEKVIENVYHISVDAFYPTMFRVEMGIVQGRDGGLLLHNLVPHQPHTVQQLKKLGPVHFIFVASCMHDSFVDAWVKEFPKALLIGDLADASILSTCFHMDGYWQDATVTKALEENFGVNVRPQIGFWAHPIKDYADQTTVITTPSNNAVVIAPHLIAKREPLLSYFTSWLAGYQGQPIAPNWKYTYCGNPVGLRASFKKELQELKPLAVLCW
jgi:hypothetical protein